jgi:acyl carrier protein
MSGVAWLVLGATSIYGFLSVFLPQRMLKQRIQSREALAFDEIYRTNFQHLPCPRVVIEETWNDLARDLQLDATKLRPTDRFREELSVKSFPLVDLSGAVESRLKQRLRKTEAETNLAQLKTIGECVELLCSLTTQHQRT